MKVLFEAVLWNQAAAWSLSPGTLADTIIDKVDDNTLSVDGVVIYFPPEIYRYDGVVDATKGVINEAYRDDTGELLIRMPRFYSFPGLPEWATGKFEELQ